MSSVTLSMTTGPADGNYNVPSPEIVETWSSKVDYVIYYNEELWEDWVDNALLTGSDIQNASNTTLFSKKAFRVIGSFPENHTDGDTICLIDSRPFNGYGGTCISTLGAG